MNLFLDSDDEWDDSDYAGVYLLTETVEVDPYRVDIAKLDSSDTLKSQITGGYILKYDDVPEGADVQPIDTKGIGQIVVEYPPGSQLTFDQFCWIEDRMLEFENVLFGAAFADPEAGYAKYIDVGSWVDYHIIGDLLTRNPTSFLRDAFFYKDRGENAKLAMGPVWGFDEAMAGAASGFWREDLPHRPRDHQSRYEVWRRLFEDPEFLQRYAARWFELREGPLQLDAILADIDDNVSLLKQAENHDSRALLSEPIQYQLFVDHLKDWITERVTWADSVMKPIYVTPPELSFAAPQVSISYPAGTVYHTRDGSDPRYADAPIKYDRPFSIAGTTTVNARVRLADGSWSVLRSETFSTNEPAGATNLRVTEINFDPYPPQQTEIVARQDVEDDDFEYIEVTNVASETIHLANAAFRDGIEFVFPPVDLAAGEHAVVVRDVGAFRLRYGDNPRVIGQFDKGLQESGDRISLEDAAGGVIHDFRYHDWWYPPNDTTGRTLAVVNICGDYGVRETWLPSQQRGGSPGSPESFQTYPPPSAGDANGDCAFDQRDVVFVLQGAKYLSRLPATFAEGDWNGDGVFDRLDIVTALQTGKYLQDRSTCLR